MTPSSVLSTTPRAAVKRAFARYQRRTPAVGATLLIYHRVGGGTLDELDVDVDAFARQLRMLERHDVVSLDDALDRLDAGDTSPSFVLTFDDGFEDVFDHAWPLLRELQLPFTVYLASDFVGEEMVWEGSTAEGSPGRGMTWGQLSEMLASGLCTIGNHTHRHVRPDVLTAAELDDCTRAIEQNLGVTPTNFTYPWGIAVPRMEPELRARFRSASTGSVGRNDPSADRYQLRRVPVRRTDPDEFFAAKLVGELTPERSYERVVRVAKAVGFTRSAYSRRVAARRATSA